MSDSNQVSTVTYKQQPFIHREFPVIPEYEEQLYVERRKMQKQPSYAALFELMTRIKLKQPKKNFLGYESQIHPVARKNNFSQDYSDKLTSLPKIQRQNTTSILPSLVQAASEKEIQIKHKLTKSKDFSSLSMLNKQLKKDAKAIDLRIKKMNSLQFDLSPDEIRPARIFMSPENVKAIDEQINEVNYDEQLLLQFSSAKIQKQKALATHDPYSENQTQLPRHQKEETSLSSFSPQIKSVDFSTRKGHFSIKDCWTNYKSESKLEIDEKRQFTSAVKEEIDRYRQLSEIKYDKSRHRSSQLAPQLLEFRDKIMQNFEIQDMKLKHLNKFKKQRKDSFLYDRYSIEIPKSSEEERINSAMKRELIEKQTKANFVQFVESLCIRDTKPKLNPTQSTIMYTPRAYMKKVDRKMKRGKTYCANQEGLNLPNSVIQEQSLTPKNDY